MLFVLVFLNKNGVYLRLFKEIVNDFKAKFFVVSEIDNNFTSENPKLFSALHIRETIKPEKARGKR